MPIVNGVDRSDAYIFGYDKGVAGELYFEWYGYEPTEVMAGFTDGQSQAAKDRSHKYRHPSERKELVAMGKTGRETPINVEASEGFAKARASLTVDEIAALEFKWAIEFPYFRADFDRVSRHVTCGMMEDVFEIVNAKPTMNKLRKRFIEEVDEVHGFTMIAVAVEMPTGHVETIVNYHGIPDKIKWYMEKYDDKFVMVANKDIRIVGFMLV